MTAASPVRQRFANGSPSALEPRTAPSFRRFAKPFRAKQETAKQGVGETKHTHAVDCASTRSHPEQLQIDVDTLLGDSPLECFRAYVANADPYDPAAAPIPY